MIHYAMPCHAMSSMSHHVCHVMPRQVISLCYATSCHFKSAHNMYVMSCHINLCHYHISCQSMPCHVITCISCNVIPCQVRSLYYAMKYHVKSSHYMYVMLSRVITLYRHIMSVMLSHAYHVM